MKTLRKTSVASAIVLALLAAAVSTASSAPPATSIFHGCPHGLEPLSGHRWELPAIETARKFLTTTYARWNRQLRWGLNLTGAQPEKPLLVRSRLQSGWVKRECGVGVWRRAAVVPFKLSAMDHPNPRSACLNCASVTLLLGRKPSGWLVWGQY
jgi:hypothetical protein